MGDRLAPYEVDRTTGFPKVSGSCRAVSGGRTVYVQQIAGTGKASVVTLLTTDIGRDTQEFDGVMKS